MSADVNLVCKAVLFDMDGTLVDSTRVVERAWGWWAARHDLPVDDVLSFSHGRPAHATMQHFLPDRDHTKDLEERVHYEETELDGVVAVPGAFEVLGSLRRYPWAIVTSAWRTLAEARVNAAGLPMPDVLVPADEIHNPKPSPEGYLLAAERLGVAPNECLVFEDARPGIEAGINAGMQVVGLLTTFRAASLRHPTLIEDLREVTIRPDREYLKVQLRCQVQ